MVFKCFLIIFLIARISEAEHSFEELITTSEYPPFIYESSQHLFTTFLDKYYTNDSFDSGVRLVGIMTLFMYAMSVSMALLAEMHEYDYWSELYEKDKRKSFSRETNTVREIGENVNKTGDEKVIVLPTNQMKVMAVKFRRRMQHLKKGNKSESSDEEKKSDSQQSKSATVKKKKKKVKESKRPKRSRDVQKTQSCSKESQRNKNSQSKESTSQSHMKKTTTTKDTEKSNKSNKMKQPDKTKRVEVEEKKKEADAAEKQQQDKKNKRNLKIPKPTSIMEKSTKSRMGAISQKTIRRQAKLGNQDEEEEPKPKLKLPPKNFHEMALKALEEELNESIESEQASKQEKTSNLERPSKQEKTIKNDKTRKIDNNEEKIP